MQLNLIAVISGIITIIGFLIWFWNKAKKAGYDEGIRDEQKRTDEKIKELAHKLYSNNDNTDNSVNTHFSVSDSNAWSATPKTRTTSWMVSRNADGSIRGDAEGSVFDGE